MTRMSYKSVLRAKGIKPLRAPAHTVKADGDVELLPVRGVIVHRTAPMSKLMAFSKEQAESTIIEFMMEGHQ